MTCGDTGRGTRDGGGGIAIGRPGAAPTAATAGGAAGAATGAMRTGEPRCIGSLTSITARATGWRWISTSLGTTVTAPGTPWLPYMIGPVGTCGRARPGGWWLTRST